MWPWTSKVISVSLFPHQRAGAGNSTSCLLLVQLKWLHNVTSASYKQSAQYMLVDMMLFRKQQQLLHGLPSQRMDYACEKGWQRTISVYYCYKYLKGFWNSSLLRVIFILQGFRECRWIFISEEKGSHLTDPETMTPDLQLLREPAYPLARLCLFPRNSLWFHVCVPLNTRVAFAPWSRSC